MNEYSLETEFDLRFVCNLQKKIFGAQIGADKKHSCLKSVKVLLQKKHKCILEKGKINIIILLNNMVLTFV